MNILKRAYKKYKIRKLRKSLENQPFEPAFCHISKDDCGKTEIWMLL